MARDIFRQERKLKRMSWNIHHKWEKQTAITTDVNYNATLVSALDLINKVQDTPYRHLSISFSMYSENLKAHICLRFPSFHNIKMVQVIGIIPQGRKGLVYSPGIIPWLR